MRAPVSSEEKHWSSPHFGPHCPRLLSLFPLSHLFSGIDPNYVPPKDDPRRVVISEFSIIFKDHEHPATLKFNTQADIEAAKKTALIVKEGCQFKIRITFRASPISAPPPPPPSP